MFVKLKNKSKTDIYYRCSGNSYLHHKTGMERYVCKRDGNEGKKLDGREKN